MPEDISKEFKKKISLKEFEVTNTANSGGEYGNGWDVKEAAKQLKIKVIYPFYDKIRFMTKYISFIGHFQK